MGVAGAVSLAEMLQTNKVLEHLSLNNCDIGDDGVHAMAQGNPAVSAPSWDDNCMYISGFSTISQPNAADSRAGHKWPVRCHCPAYRGHAQTQQYSGGPVTLAE